MNTDNHIYQNYHSVHQKFPAIRIGVIGGSNPSKEILRIAEEVGRLIAKNNAIVICGGLGGVMESACKGAKEERGITIGILPSKDKNDANPYVDIAIPTGLGEARNLIVVLSSDALIAINGSYGTLSEISYALLNRKPVIAIKSWELFKEGEKEKNIVYVNSSEEAVKKALTISKRKDA